MNILIWHNKNTLDVVNEDTISVGDQVETGRDSMGRSIYSKIIHVHEQLKERGVYKDEARRRMWAKVTIKQ